MINYYSTYKKFLLVVIIIFFSFSLMLCASIKEQKTKIIPPLEQSSFLEEAEKIYNTMSLEEKIGQLLIIRVKVPHTNSLTEMTPEFKEILLDIHPGGLIFFSKNIQSSSQIKKFVEETQSISKKIPMFISVDAEGGKVNRFKNIDNTLLSQIPPASEMALRFTPDELKSYSAQIGLELKKLGFNMNFAPVADVLYDNTPNFLKRRIFGTSAKIITDYSVAFMEGQNNAGIISVMKHFPGHGGATGDTHLQGATVHTNLPHLQNYDFLPYKKAVQHGLSAVMLGHLKVPSIDRNNIATLSPSLITILQQDVGFNGVIISDSLRMKSVTLLFNTTLEIDAINAGVNILLDPDDPSNIHKNLLRAVTNGHISDERLKTTVLKILVLKLRFSIIDRELYLSNNFL